MVLSKTCLLSLEDIESFERPAGFSAGPSERAVFERQLGEERDAQRNHLEQLHDLNTWQFRTLVKDVIQQEDWEIKDAARSRATSSDRVIAVAVCILPCDWTGRRS